MNVTATEIRERQAEGFKLLAKRFEASQESKVDAVLADMLLVFGRTVCARRARKLRKRGCKTRFVGYTSTGKIRYAVMLDVTYM